MYCLRHRPTDPISLESAILGRSAPTDRPAPSARCGPARPGPARPTDPLRHTLTLRTPSERADRPTHLWLVAPEVARLALLELFAFGSGRRIQAHQVLAMRLVCLRGCHHRRAVACVELVRTTTRRVREHGGLVHPKSGACVQGGVCAGKGHARMCADCGHKRQNLLKVCVVAHF